MKAIILKKDLEPIISNVVSQISTAVGSTLGYYGKNVILQRPSGIPYTTKDGVSVAKAIEFDSQVENIIADIIKDVAYRVVTECGDGTTTSIVLTNAIYQSGLKYINMGSNVTELKNGMFKASVAVIDFLNSVKTEVNFNGDDLYNVALISSNGDAEIAEIIVSTIKEIGTDGIIIVSESLSHETEVEITQGFQLESGMLTTELFPEDTVEQTYKNTKVLVSNKKIANITEFVPVLEYIHANQLPLLVFAPEYSVEFVKFISTNIRSAGMTIGLIRVPFRAEIQNGYIEDIALLTKSTIFDDTIKITKANVETILGTGIEILVRQETTTFMEIAEDLERQLLSRIDKINKMITNTENQLYKEQLQRRLSKLSGGFANIRVGGISQIEMMEKKDRVDDALNAVKSAIEQGIVPGAGSAYLRACNVLQELKGNSPDENTGIKVIFYAIQSPFIQLMQNADLDYKHYIDTIRNDSVHSHGINLKTKEYSNLFEDGIIDPVKVLKSAITNSVSTAAMLLTTSSMVINERVKVNDLM